MHIPYSEGLGIHPQDAVFLEREVWDLGGVDARRSAARCCCTSTRS